MAEVAKLYYGTSSGWPLQVFRFLAVWLMEQSQLLAWNPWISSLTCSLACQTWSLSSLFPSHFQMSLIISR